MGYPLQNHRKVGPQPEFCELCGERRPGAEFIRSEVEGLRGRLICSTTPSCRRYRSRLTWRDKFRELDKRATIGSGKHPVFDPGASDWSEDYA